MKKTLLAHAHTLILLFALFVSSFAFGQEPPTKKVAVVMNMGTDGPQGAYLRHDAELAKRMYLEQGYQVIELSNEFDKNPKKWATKQNLEAELAKISGASEIKIDLYGHGKLRYTSEVPATMKDRYPVVSHPPASKKGGDQTINFDKSSTYLAVSVTPELADMDPHSLDPKAKAAADAKMFESSLGVNDLRKIIEKARTRNPGVKTELLALNCFGGCMGQELSDIPGLTIFTATEATKLAAEFADPNDPDPYKGSQGRMTPEDVKKQAEKSLNYPLFMKRKIDRAIQDGKPISMNEAHQAVIEDMMRSMLWDGKRESLNFPLSAAQNFILGWCNRKADCNCRVRTDFTEQEKLRDIDLGLRMQDSRCVADGVFNWADQKLKSNQCSELGDSYKADQEERKKTRERLALLAFEKVEKNLNKIDLADPVKIQRDRMAELRQDLETATGAAFCPKDQPNCPAAREWQYEQKYIDKIKAQIAANAPVKISELKAQVKAQLEHLKKTDCFAAHPKNCDAPFDSQMEYMQFLNLTADLIEPQKENPSAGPPMGPPAGICSIPMPQRAPPKPGEKPVWQAPKTIQEKLADNRKITECIENKIKNDPNVEIIRLALETASQGPGRYTEAQELCDNYRLQKDVYKEQVACSERFLSQADSKTKARLSEIYKEGDRKITIPSVLPTPSKK